MERSSPALRNPTRHCHVTPATKAKHAPGGFLSAFASFRPKETRRETPQKNEQLSPSTARKERTRTAHTGSQRASAGRARLPPLPARRIPLPSTAAPLLHRFIQVSPPCLLLARMNPEPILRLIEPESLSSAPQVRSV